MTDLIPTGDEIKAIETMAKHANESKFFSNLNGYGGIFSIAMFARELGLPVMQCLFGGMTNIKGKIEVAPRMMNLMIRKAGHQIHILRSDDEVCILKGIRKDTGEFYECSYSLAEASKAGLANKDNYKNYAGDMLFARCISRLARRLFADVIGSSYIEGEIEDNSPKSAPENAEEAITIESGLPKEDELPLSDEQLVSLDVLLQQIDDKEYLEKLKGHLGVPAVHSITQKDYARTIKSLKRRIESKEKVHESSAVA